MARDRISEWSEALERDGRVEIDQPRGWLFVLLLACFAFVAIGVAMVVTAPDTSTRVGGAVCGLVFVPGLWVFPRRLLRGGPALVVDSQGLTMPPYDASIPWSAAYGTQVFRTRGTTLVQVEADPRWLEEFYSSHRLMGLARYMNQTLTRGVPCLSLPSPIKADSMQLALWLGEEIRTRNPARR